jgi:hypothetical protein
MKRKANGQFAPGHSGNPNGRPKKAREERYLEIIKQSVTFKDFRDIIKMLVQKSKDGDLTAARLLLEYTVGKPEQGIDIKSAGQPLFRVIQDDD